WLRWLATRWLERCLAMLPVAAPSAFPTDSLLDHVPALILEISEYLRQDETAIAANTAILDKARELGALRHGQRASLHQILREYQVLGSVLVAFVLDEMERENGSSQPADCAVPAARLHQAEHVALPSPTQAFVAPYIQINAPR